MSKGKQPTNTHISASHGQLQARQKQEEKPSRLNAPPEPGKYFTPKAEKEYLEERKRREEEDKVRLIGADREASERKKDTIKSRNIKPFPILLTLLCLICAGLALFTIYDTLQVSELRSTRNKTRNEVQALEQNRQELELELEKKNDLLLIEKYAVSYGMVRIDQLTRNYLSISGDDIIEVYPED